MDATPSLALRRPNKPGFMAPFVLLEMVRAIEDVLGPEDVQTALMDAQLHRLPDSDEPVREDKAARLHQSVRRLFPDHALEICRLAGEGAAMRIMESQITKRAQTMLAKMPRATGAWLLAKTARQNAWTFSGTGDFVVESEQRFILRENPVVLGEDAIGVVCYFHASLFEKLFSTLIHPGLICHEVACHARGDDACIFEFTLPTASADH